MKNIKIKNRYVGENQPTLIIAEVGVNHNGSLERGFELIDKAAESGVDVVKFQTYKASQITTKKAERYWSDSLNTDKNGTQFDTFSKLDSMDIEGFKAFKKRCEEKNVIFTSTPFNIPDVELLEAVGIDFFKISSSDITYHGLLDFIAKKRKPIVLSTGCSSLAEIDTAISIIKNAGNENIILQHCILQYPCDDENANLIKMKRIQSSFPEIPVGYSDHTIGITIPTMSVAMGAVSVEKHFTIDNSLPDSPDHKLSATPEIMKKMVEEIRKVEVARGYFENGYYPCEEKAYMHARKSLVSQSFIKKGTIITQKMLTAKRPGTGVYPENINFVLGKKALIDIAEDSTITMDMF